MADHVSELVRQLKDGSIPKAEFTARLASIYRERNEARQSQNNSTQANAASPSSPPPPRPHKPPSVRNLWQTVSPPNNNQPAPVTPTTTPATSSSSSAALASGQAGSSALNLSAAQRRAMVLQFVAQQKQERSSGDDGKVQGDSTRNFDLNAIEDQLEEARQLATPRSATPTHGNVQQVSAAYSPSGQPQQLYMSDLTTTSQHSTRDVRGAAGSGIVPSSGGADDHYMPLDELAKMGLSQAPLSPINPRGAGPRAAAHWDVGAHQGDDWSGAERYDDDEEEQEEEEEEYDDGGDYSDQEYHIHDANGRQQHVSTPAVRVRAKSASTRRRPGSAQLPYQHSSRTVARRQLLVKQLREEESKKCTFKPSIHPLPDQYSTRHEESTPFLDRATLWAARRKQYIEQKQKEKEEMEVAGCSFKPSVSPSTTSLLDSVTRKKVFEERSRARRRILEQRVRMEREKEYKETCTFRPNLNKKSLLLAEQRDLTMLYGTDDELAMLASTKRKPVATEEDLECTFAPRTNPVKPEMRSAALYLQQDTFERLSRPRYVSSSLAPSITAKAQSVGGSPRSSGVDSSATTPRRQPDKAAINIRGTRTAPPASRRRRSTSSKQFQNFLLRQQYQLQRKRDKVNALRHDLDRDLGTPMINRKSKKMMESPHHPDARGKFSGTTFFDRVRVSSEAKKSMHAQEMMDEECTFQPAINMKSKQMKPKTPAELSSNDVIRRKARMQQVRMQARKAELQGATFSPQLLSSAQKRARARSKLGLDMSHAQYTQQLKAEQEAKEEARRQSRAAREQAEETDCTFKPTLNEPPEYIKNMTVADREKRRAMLLKKRKQTRRRGKPDWK